MAPASCGVVVMTVSEPANARGFPHRGWARQQRQQWRRGRVNSRGQGDGGSLAIPCHASQVPKFIFVRHLPREISPRDTPRQGGKLPRMKHPLYSLFAVVSLAALTLSAARAADEKEVAVIKTNLGEMVAEFWPDVAPKTVANFKRLANDKFYDGTAFHRVIKDFMIQGGDPLTRDDSKQARWGTGDPGYKIDAEFSDKKHTRGVLSMARSADPNSAGSQFFICHGNPSFLDGKYTAFGKLIKGDDVLEKIATTKTGPRDVPEQKVVVESIKIVPADSVK
jgi:peptidyl-prolyl cis-trans isomerase B (cyclophilin B)